MMALELLDTKWAGVIQPDPAPPKLTSRARRMAPDRSETCSLVMMLDAWLCTVLGLTPSASRPQRCPGPANNPRTSGLTFGELGKGR
jgi:hypothetical protein